MDENTSISEHIHAFRIIFDDLTSVGAIIPADDQLETFLGSLSEAYSNTTDILCNTPGLTLQDAMARLLQEELRRKTNGISNEIPSTVSLWTDKSQKKRI